MTTTPSSAKAVATPEPTEAEVYKTLVVSTGHLSKKTFDELQVQATIKGLWWIEEYEYGLRVIGLNANKEAVLDDAKQYPDLRPIVEWALGLGCTHIDIDRDGLVYEQLPEFEW